jgi:hypothetical protein
VWQQDIKTKGISYWNWNLGYPKVGCGLCNVEKPKKKVQKDWVEEGIV